MKAIALLLGMIMSLNGQDMRTWTNKEGLTVKGRMIAKTDTSVSVLANGRRYIVQLDNLSQIDLEYVQETTVQNKVDLNVQTVKQGSATDNTLSHRTIKISLRRYADKPVDVEVIWIGEGDEKSSYGVYKRDKKQCSFDGDYFFEVAFRKDGSFSQQHKAHIVIVRDENGKQIEYYESLKGMDKYAN